jgi:hypothetical protein
MKTSSWLVDICTSRNATLLGINVEGAKYGLERDDGSSRKRHSAETLLQRVAYHVPARLITFSGLQLIQYFESEPRTCGVCFPRRR